MIDASAVIELLIEDGADQAMMVYCTVGLLASEQLLAECARDDAISEWRHSAAGSRKRAARQRSGEERSRPMPATLRHFAINADNVPRAKAFYENAFGWIFAPWGPPGFYQTFSSGEGHIGALQERREIGGQRMPGMEMTFAVDDIQAAIRAIETQGGKVLSAPFHIETVGHLVFFQDTEGNIAGAMQYDRGRWSE